MRARVSQKFADLARDEDGATLVEFSLVIGIFLFLFFGLIDFARLGFTSVLAQKATEAAVRMAVVRPAMCEGVPTVVRRTLLTGTLSLDLPNGTRCSARNGLCKTETTVSCLGSANTPQAAAIWAQVSGLMPTGAQISNLRFSYSYDADLNRVGAPYTPIVTVDIADLTFDFISPLGRLATFSGASDASDLGASFIFPAMSASLPSEDLK
jgi:hypothetical protein